MAKTNTQRQADFRRKMRQEGKQAINVWVTADQAEQIRAILAGERPQALPVTARPARQKTLLVTPKGRKIALPAIPAKAPESVARGLKAEEQMLRKKLAQIEKLQKDAVAIEKHFRQTVKECERL